jgi:hypothetical protein
MKTQAAHKTLAFAMFAFCLCFCAGQLLAQELSASSGPVDVPGNGCPTSVGCGAGSPDPECPNPYVHCKVIKVTVPQAAQNIRAVPTASKDGANWVDCPAHPNGAVYPFMDCAKNISWIRFKEVQPTIQTDANGIHVLWEVINWASYTQYGKVTVYYTLPK